jgi:hypothetical protein
VKIALRCPPGGSCAILLMFGALAASARLRCFSTGNFAKASISAPLSSGVPMISGSTTTLAGAACGLRPLPVFLAVSSMKASACSVSF